MRLRWYALLLASALAIITAACSGDGAPIEATETATTPAPSVASSPPAPVSTEPPGPPTLIVTDGALSVSAVPGADHEIGMLETGTPVEVVGRLEDGSWLALTGLGWTPAVVEGIEVSVPVSELPIIQATDSRAAPPPYPHGWRSGIEHVDTILELVEAQDLGGLAALIETHGQACGVAESDHPDARTWPCPAGIETGTVLQRFSYDACGGGGTRPGPPRSLTSERCSSRSTRAIGPSRDATSPRSTSITSSVEQAMRAAFTSTSCTAR